jgi:hypothetical protein
MIFVWPLMVLGIWGLETPQSLYINSTQIEHMLRKESSILVSEQGFPAFESFPAPIQSSHQFQSGQAGKKASIDSRNTESNLSLLACH